MKYPIIQGPFGGGFSTENLLLEVSNRGGLGSFGAHTLGCEELAALIKRLKRKTSNPFSINLWTSKADAKARLLVESEFNHEADKLDPIYKRFGVDRPEWSALDGEISIESQLQVILDETPPVFSFVFGTVPRDFLQACREKSVFTIGAATTLEEAIAIEAAGVDAVVATGFEAGGHRPSFLKAPEASYVGTLALTRIVSERVKIPVISAGGFVDAAGVKAGLSLGADAVQIGTAFLACQESGASDIHRDELMSSRAEDTQLSRAFTGRVARYISNRFIQKTESQGNSFLPYPYQDKLTQGLKKAAFEQGNRDAMALYCGQGASLLKHRRVSDLMEELTRDF